jgi:hypothetical protein
VETLEFFDLQGHRVSQRLDERQVAFVGGYRGPEDAHAAAFLAATRNWDRADSHVLQYRDGARPALRAARQYVFSGVNSWPFEQ